MEVREVCRYFYLGFCCYMCNFCSYQHYNLIFCRHYWCRIHYEPGWGCCICLTRFSKNLNNINGRCCSCFYYLYVVPGLVSRDRCVDDFEENFRRNGCTDQEDDISKIGRRTGAVYIVILASRHRWDWFILLLILFVKITESGDAIISRKKIVTVQMTRMTYQKVGVEQVKCNQKFLL